MTIQPTIAFSFSPTCRSFKCGCCSGTDDDDLHVYPQKSGNFKFVDYLSDNELEKANKRFREIIIRKIDPLPLNNDEFMKRLEEEEGVDLTVTRSYPLTKYRMDKTIEVINEILSKMHVQ